jgi:DedD protein
MRFPFFRAKAPDTASPPPPRKPRAGRGGPVEVGDVQRSRVQARRRLMGALVLLVAGVVGFPILFETQPRPLPVDLPILATASAGASSTSPVPEALQASGARPASVLPPDAGNEVAVAATAAAQNAGDAKPAEPAASPAVVAREAGLPPLAAATPAPPHPKPAPVPAPEPQRPEPAKRAPAKTTPAATAAAPAPDSPAPAATAAARYVVQVGAYNEVERMRAARQRLEKLGFKSYTQDVDTPTGKRTRVRVGPFGTRQEAEAVAGKVKAVGMQANIVTL